MMATAEAPVKMGNVRVFEKASLRDRVEGILPITVPGQQQTPTILRGLSLEEAEKVLKDRIEAGKEKYGELCHSRVYRKTQAGQLIPEGQMSGLPDDGWLYAEASYRGEGKGADYHAVVHVQGGVISVYGY